MSEISVDLPSNAWCRKGNSISFDTPEAAAELIERVKAAVESCEPDLRVLAGVE